MADPRGPLDPEASILRSLRRISRAVDLHSRRLASTYQLTGPQLICLRLILEVGETTPSFIAREVCLSQATVTGILDRLARRELVVRERDTTDRRRVLVRATDAGEALATSAPSSLQDRLARNLERLPPEVQDRIADSLNQVVELMEAEDLDAAPLLATGPMSAAPAQVLGLLDQAE